MTQAALGLVVNPVAGMGGAVGLHGTDDDSLALARERGAVPVAPARAARAVARLHELAPRLSVVAAGGQMGADHLAGVGWEVRTLPAPVGDSDADDTRSAVAAMVAAGVRLVLFVGGDGTARVVADAAGEVPVLGVPAGVKMHSGVFGTTPEGAAVAAARYLAEPGRFPTRNAEVVDRDAAGDVRLFGTVRVPAVPAGVQHPKGASAGGADDAAALGREVAAESRPGCLYLLGPGTTVAAVNAALGLPASALGVDAVLDGCLLARDASEAELLVLLAQHPRARLVLGVVGGQGFLLGRGNQQLSPAVLRAVGLEHLDVLAVPAKVAALAEPVLHIDIDDADLAAHLVGYRRVRTGRARSTVLRVVA
ncbi:NAD(+)/NADH kinase [Nocardioides sp. 503]|uniref:ATP-NAD kinase family protein n=1 Tax=Nocardioides sp. 503 TaxID=2508326 RepID=UPI001ADC8538|nr:NAD(+)/NADH kinase [Nocardioides sp. 503]